jgi:hypothetical protein
MIAAPVSVFVIDAIRYSVEASGARISPKVPRLHVTSPGHNAEAVVAPLVPDRRQENRAVALVRREDGEERQLQQVSQVVRSQPFAHSPSLPRGEHRRLGTPVEKPANRRPLRSRNLAPSAAR